MTSVPTGGSSPMGQARGRWPRGADAAVILAAILALPLACSSSSTKQGGFQGAVPVAAANVQRQDVANKVTAIGTVEAYNTVKVRARVGGELVRVAFQEGKDVRQGDLLFTIDPRPFEVALQSAVADSARDSAKAEAASALAERDVDLVQKDYITKQDYDQAVSDAAAAKATVQADAADCRNARLNLSFCYIRAPINGRAGSLLMHPGNLINANDPNPLVTIQQILPVYVVFSVPEKVLPQVRQHAAEGQLAVQAKLSNNASTVYTGELAVIDNAVDESTGTIMLKALFPNQDEALWPGEFVNVSLVLSTEHDALVVPSQAIQSGQQGDFVYLIKPDLTVAMQPVEVGTVMDSSVVVKKGLQAEDRVVTDGQLRLIPGAKVDIKSGSQPGGASKQ